MEKSKFLYGALGFLALGLASCSSDDPVVKDVIEKDGVRYMRVAISSPAEISGRADEQFAEATDAENAVNNVCFKFFDRQGRNIYNTTESDVEFVEAVAPDSPNAGKVKEAVVRIGVVEGEGLPAYVLCFINPTNWKDIQGEENVLNSFRDLKRQSFMQGQYFSMNNSVYFGEDPVSGASNVKISGTPITYDQLFTSEAEAEAAKDGSVVDIYVERYAAKINFTMADAAIKDYSFDGYTLKFIPESWNINADAPDMYAIKRFENANAATDEIPSLGQVNQMLEGWTTWNSPENHRSYWACSPGYYATEFPEVSDQIADAATEGTGAGEVFDGVNALKYYSYNQILEDGNKAFNNGGDNFVYTFENTMSQLAFESKNPKAAAPSVVVIGKYNITGVAENTDFYIYSDHIYFNEAVAGSHTAQTMMQRMIQANSVLYIRDADGKYVVLNNDNITPEIEAYLNIKHPDRDVRGTAVVSHRYVTLQLEGITGETGLFYSPTGTDRYLAVTADNFNQVNTILWNQIGNAEHFEEGRCYYSIPIRHLGWSERGEARLHPTFVNGVPQNGGVLTQDGGIYWPNVLVGDFGLVRNHVYDIVVNDVTGRATGIDNLDYPIVPPADIDSYWIKYKLNILNWRVVPTQEVDLK